jgi:hypothetical protein
MKVIWVSRKKSLGAGLIFLACSTSLVAQAPRCTRVVLTEPEPLWISSAVYVNSLKEIAVVDPLRNNLVLIGQNGTSHLYDPKRLISDKEKMTPGILNSTGPDSFSLSMIDQRLYRLDAELNKVGLEDLAKAATGAQGSIISTYDSVVSGGEFFSFGAVKAADSQIHFGFFQAPIKDPTRVTFLKDFNDVDYYLLGHHYLADLAGEKYAVMMSPNKPVIVHFPHDGPAEVMDVIPENYKRAPKFKTEQNGPNSEVALFKEIEGLTIPVGLYGNQDGNLYLLTREPRAGKTRWRLFRIDPKRRLPTREAELPTTANHLTVLNTPDNWYIFEKGPVQPLGKQQIGSMLTIPSSAIRSLTIPGLCQTMK